MVKLKIYIFSILLRVDSIIIFFLRKAQFLIINYNYRNINYIYRSILCASNYAIKIRSNKLTKYLACFLKKKKNSFKRIISMVYITKKIIIDLQACLERYYCSDVLIYFCI